MNRPRQERVVALLAVAIAIGVFVWGVLAEQIGDTLFNATLV